MCLNNNKFVDCAMGIIMVYGSTAVKYYNRARRGYGPLIGSICLK